MAEEIIVRKVEIDVEGAVQNLDAVEASTEKVTQSTEKLEKQMGDIPGPLGKVQQGVRGLSKAFKALLANPIVLILAAIVAGLAALAKAFSKTQVGADKIKDAMAGVSATIDVLTERAAKLFKALGQIIRGNFKQGFDEMKESVSGVGEEIRAATRDAIAYEQQVRKVFNAETNLIVVNAERRKQISELRLISRDLTKSYQERIDALEQANVIEIEGLEAAVQLQRDKVDLIRTEIANTPETLRTREQSRALAEAEVALTDLQTQSLERQKGLLDEVNAIKATQAAAAASAIAAEEAKKKEAEAAEAEKRKAESDRRKEERELELMLEEEFNNAMAELNKSLAEETKKVQDETTANFIENAEKEAAAAIMAEERKRQAKQASLAFGNQILSDGFSALMGFLGEESKIGKKIQIADATRAAIMGAIQAYQSASAVPIVGPVLGPIAGAAALVAGMANVKKMASVSDPVSGASTVPSVSLARPTANIGSTDLMNAEQGIPTDVAIVQDSVKRPSQKAYVVASDMTAEQDIERKRAAEATL